MFRKIFRLRNMPSYAAKVRDLVFYRTEKPAPPLRLQLELASVCNLRCKFCVLSVLRREKKFMPYESVKKILDESKAGYVQLSGIGETFLHPDIARIMRYAKNGGRFVKITTNGLLITGEIAESIVDSGLDMLDVSIDTTDPALYSRIRGADFAKVINNIRTVYDCRNLRKSGLVIRAKHIYNAENIAHLPSDVEKLAELPFDEALFLWVRDIYEGSNQNGQRGEFLPILEKALQKARELKRPGMIEAVNILKETLFSGTTADKCCCEPLYAPYVTVDGDLIPCCKCAMWTLQRPENMNGLKMGNVLTDSFDAVWQSPRAAGIRRAIIENRAAVNFCGTCSKDENAVFRVINRFSRKFIYS
ncbi:MAG: radical SAM protein [Elusimicrobiales bacterium]|nr:radical SAM protein [Elusimicrobiales bacterium]